MEVATAPKGPPNSYTKAASLPLWTAATAAAAMLGVLVVLVVLVVADDLLREGVVLFDFFGDFFLVGVLARGFFAAANALAALLLTAGVVDFLLGVAFFWVLIF